MRLKKYTSLFIAMLLSSAIGSVLQAQDTNKDGHDITIKIPEVALLDIEPSGSTSFTLEPEAPTEAGDTLDFSKALNEDLWLNYSSVIGSKSDPERKVTVAITNGKVPGGMELKVTASKDAGNGGGKVGSPGSTLTLSDTDQDLISGIGSCWTNTPENNGHQLTYKLSLASGGYENLDFDDANVLTITYTLTDK